MPNSINISREKVFSGEFLGYRGVKSNIWTKSKDDGDWSGCYFTNSLSYAKSYITELGEGNGSVWIIYARTNLTLVVCSSAFITSSSINQDVKAYELKKQLGLSPETKLIMAISSKGEIYQGPAYSDADGKQEFVVSWASFNQLLRFDLEGQYRIKNYEIKSYSINQILINC